LQAVKNKNAQLYDVRIDGARILEHLAIGGHFRQACRAAGIAPSTAQLWRRLGRLAVGEHEAHHLARPEHIWFEQAVQETLAKFEMQILGYWVKHAEDNWQAARDLLARRFPDRWGNTEQRQIQLHTATPMQMELQLVWGDEDRRRDERSQRSRLPSEIDRG
jgi:hypothetical protein